MTTQMERNSSLLGCFVAVATRGPSTPSFVLLHAHLRQASDERPRGGGRKLRRDPRNLIKFSLAKEKNHQTKIGSRREAKRELNLMPRLRRLPVTQKINLRSFLSRVGWSGIVGKLRGRMMSSLSLRAQRESFDDSTAELALRSWWNCHHLSLLLVSSLLKIVKHFAVIPRSAR